MSGLYRGYYPVYIGGAGVGALLMHGGWWFLMPAIAVGVWASFARVD